MSDILTTVGRLVSGHPMVMHAANDNKGVQKTFKDGSLMFTQSVGIAFAKGAETHWNQTQWGMAIYAAAQAAFPQGQHGAPTFAWKITDGDSAVPNKKGNKPCDREGYPGHWVLFATSCFPTPTYHAGRYAAHEVIQNKDEIKAGDYVRLSFNVSGNGSTDSPGMYINPVMLELTRAGIQIISANAPDASAAFGGSAGVLPQGAMVDTNVQPVTPVTHVTAAVVTPVQAAVTTPVQPATDLVQPQTLTPGVVTPPPVIAPPVVEESYIIDGVTHTKAALLAMPGWTEAHLANLTKA